MGNKSTAILGNGSKGKIFRVFLVKINRTLLITKTICNLSIDEMQIQILTSDSQKLLFELPIHYSQIYDIKYHIRVPDLYDDKINNNYSLLSKTEIIQIKFKQTEITQQTQYLYDKWKSFTDDSNEISHYMEHYFKDKLLVLVFATIPSSPDHQPNLFITLYSNWQNYIIETGMKEIFQELPQISITEYDNIVSKILKSNDMSESTTNILKLCLHVKNNIDLKIAFFKSQLCDNLLQDLAGSPTRTEISVYLQYILAIHKLFYCALINSHQINRITQTFFHTQQQLNEFLEMITPEYRPKSTNQYNQIIKEITYFQVLTLTMINELIKYDSKIYNIKDPLTISVDERNHMTARINHYVNIFVSSFHLVRSYSVFQCFMLYAFFSLFQRFLSLSNKNILDYICEIRFDLFWTWTNKDYQYSRLLLSNNTQNEIFNYQIVQILISLDDSFKYMEINSYRRIACPEIEDYRYINLFLRTPQSTLKSSIEHQVKEDLKLKEVITLIEEKIDPNSMKSKCKYFNDNINNNEINKLLMEGQEIIDSLAMELKTRNNIQLNLHNQLLLPSNDPIIILSDYKTIFRRSMRAGKIKNPISDK